jgi:hypothetical protein
MDLQNKQLTKIQILNIFEQIVNANELVKNTCHQGIVDF